MLKLTKAGAPPVRAKHLGLTFDEVMEKLNDERCVRVSEVLASALRRKVWVSGAGSPGCLYDSGPYYHTRKADAIESCLWIVEDGAGKAPQGFKADLERYHCANHAHWRYEISQTTLADLLS